MSWFVLALTVAVVGALALVAAGATQVKRRRFALDVLKFVPAGVLLAIRGIGFWASVAIVAGVSLCIEVLQYLLATGRTADVNDLVANVTGAALGFLVAAGTAFVARART
jgi:glycopeptide antibiotics resistance protein